MVPRNLRLTVLNAIVAESLDFVATQLEKAAGKNPDPKRMQSAVVSVLSKILKQHKRVIFNGDGYSEAWHQEAARRGLPNMRETVDALAAIKAKKNVDVMVKYDILTKREMESRYHIFYEKYVKQVTIEAETMVSMARRQYVPAVLQHQRRLAEAVASTQAADVDCEDQRSELEALVERCGRLSRAVQALEKVLEHHDESPAAHAKFIRDKVKPAMSDLREVVDELEAEVSDDLWPVPTYRDLLFIK